MTYRHWQRHRRHGPPPFVRKSGCLFTALSVFAVVSLFRSPDRTAPFVVLGLAIAAALIGLVVLRKMTGRVQAQDRLRRQLMADVAHELRTPLAILQGRIEGLIDGVYPRDDDRLGELLDETRHLSRLVEDLRTLANAEAGALDLRKEPTDMAELIRDAAASFDDTSIAVDVPDDLPSADVDPVRIREVLLNLLSNAVRHTPAGGAVAVRARVEGKRMTIRVTDSGSGIAPEDLPRIFDRFHKGRDSRGSGLGLAIARNLVLAHNGSIHAESRVGEGTVVTVSLPL